jgi:hypothetical protein
MPSLQHRDEYLTLLSLMALEGQSDVIVQLLESVQQQAAWNGHFHVQLRVLLI